MITFKPVTNKLNSLKNKPQITKIQKNNFSTKVGLYTQIGVINQPDNSELKISEAK